MIGFRVFFDENRIIVGLNPILLLDQTRVDSKFFGTATNFELKWEVDPGDHLSQIYGSFSEQGYLV